MEARFELDPIHSLWNCWWGWLSLLQILRPHFLVSLHCSFICSESTPRMKVVPPSRSHRCHESAEVTADSLSHLQPAQGHWMEYVQKEQTSFQLIILSAAKHREGSPLPRKWEPTLVSHTIKLFISYTLPWQHGGHTSRGTLWAESQTDKDFWHIRDNK